MPGIYQEIEKKARNFSPSFLTPLAKTFIAYPRFYSQLKTAKKNYRQFHDQYPQNILYVAGLPKSGTTWLEKMLGSFRGLSDIMIPEAVAYEQKYKQSHGFEFPDNLFQQFNKALVILKLHAHGSLHNFNLLQKNNLNYVVLYRDLRDVAVSHIFYVQRTAYHPEYKIYKNLSIKHALLHFGNSLLPEYVKWVNGWHQHKGSANSYILRYEDLIINTTEKFSEVVNHFRINATASEIQNIIKKNSFENLSGGRNKGVDDNKSFFRKGTAGDWKNYFDEEINALYNQHLELFNKKYGY